jgi:hypothetical protein
MSIIQKITGAAANVITAGIEKITGKKYGRQTAEKNIYKSKVGKVLKVAQNVAALAATAAAGAAAVAARGGSSVVASQIAKKAGTYALKHPLKAAAAATGIGILATSAKARKAAKKTNPLEFGMDIGKAIENPTLSNITEIAKDNPLLTAAVAVAGGGLGLKAAASGISAYQSYQLKEAVLASSGNQGVIDQIDQEEIGNGQTYQTPATTAVSGQELPLGKTTRQPRRRKISKKMNNISQKVNVVVKTTGISSRKIYKYATISR